MPSNNFFQINFPYGLLKDEKNNWTCFNRISEPLSNIIIGNFVENESQKFNFTKYYGITEKFLLDIADDRFQKDSSGSINKIWLYSDIDDPGIHNSKENIDKYFEKLKKLMFLKVNHR